jgi:3-deoxy-D-manno-octulosonic-acid transferase
MWLYRILITIFGFLWKIHGLFNEESALRHRVLQDQWKRLENQTHTNKYSKRYWMHCASLGEYEQGRSVLELIQKSEPEAHITLSFFSPSGYRLKDKITCAHDVIYLPLDTLQNARRLISCIRPTLFIGVKYDFWWSLLQELQNQKIKTIWISIQLRDNHYFLRHISQVFFKLFSKIDFFCTLDTQTATILEKKGISHYAHCGDTRIDSVLSRKVNGVHKESDFHFNTDKPLIIYGSVYPEDFLYIGKVTRELPDYFHLFVPHKIDAQNCAQIFKVMDVPPTFAESAGRNYLMIARMGVLFGLYSKANLVYIGGGFGKSIHNTLEPAVFGLPVSFGPKISKFNEAKDFLDLKVAKVVHRPSDFKSFVLSYSAPKERERVRISLSGYFTENAHAADKCYIEIKKLTAI